jgi:glycosyltransferase involved in cell wall biosynthesis
MNPGSNLRTVLFSTLYPSSVRPGHGIFVEKRLSELLGSGEVDTRVVAPVPWFYSSHPRFGDYARWARTPERETWHSIAVQHPRYLVVPKVGMPLSPFTLALGALPALQRLLDEGFDFDLIDAHYYYPDGVAAALLARYFNKPLVITARGSDINLLAKYAIPCRLMQWAAKQASASIGVSQALTHRMAEMGMPKVRLKKLPNGVDLSLFRLQRQATMRTTLDWPDAPTLLSVGNLVENKGHHLAIEALKLLPDFRLVIAGEGPQRAALERLASDGLLDNRVQFLGHVAPDQLACCYSAADLLVLPSSREGWPNVLLESMACGTPVVATKVGGIPEIVCSTTAGQLMADRTVGSLVQAVQAIWRNLPAREAVRACAFGHGWQTTTQDQISLFHDMVQAWPYRGTAAFTPPGNHEPGPLV